MASVVRSVGLAVWAAAAMTAGDWVWSAFALPHRPHYGLAHGMWLCLWIGLYLGWLGGRVARAAGAGALVGLLAAASFYALAPLLGYSAILASWIGLWFGLTWLTRDALSLTRPAARLLLRAVLAGAGSGLAFYAVSGIWMAPPSAYNLAWHFPAWTIAFLPGSFAMLCCLPPPSGGVSR